MFIYAVAIAALPVLFTHAELWICAALVGLSGGMITLMFFAVWRHVFGPRHLGRIRGAAQWLLAPCVLLLSLAAFRVGLPDARIAT